MEFFLFGVLLGITIAAIRAVLLNSKEEADDSLYNTPETYGKNSPYTTPKKARRLRK